MPRFFVTKDQVMDGRIIIEGGDVKHIHKVLRMKEGDELTISDGSGYDYFCTISAIESDAVIAEIQNKWESYSELPTRICLFQGLPKSDKMELIIQKTVELGVHEIVPVDMSRCIVKLDEKKFQKKQERWQGIAEAAAKQAGRGIIPEIKPMLNMEEALRYAASMDGAIIPYENAKGIAEAKATIRELKGLHTVGIFIGPEGGFEEAEVEMAIAKGVKPITLGNRILRTETAGMAVMSILMFEFEAE